MMHFVTSKKIKEPECYRSFDYILLNIILLWNTLEK
jgi:hypothetical protein